MGNPLTQLTTDTDDSNREERTIQTVYYYFNIGEAEEENPFIWDNPALYASDFWFASLSSFVYNNDAGFGPVAFGGGGLQNYDMFYTDGTYFGGIGNNTSASNSIRPIISLSSNTMYGTEDGEITTIENPLE